MDKQEFITDMEHEKCQKVANAFTELYELTDIIVIDADRYGFVKLQFYKFPNGFDSMVIYTDSKEMFDDLWQDWFDNQVLMPVQGTPLEELDYDDIFKYLPNKKQKELMDRRSYFAEMTGVEDIIKYEKIAIKVQEIFFSNYRLLSLFP